MPAAPAVEEAPAVEAMPAGWAAGADALIPLMTARELGWRKRKPVQVKEPPAHIYAKPATSSPPKAFPASSKGQPPRDVQQQTGL